jgi:hypothetical protein
MCILGLGADMFYVKNAHFNESLNLLWLCGQESCLVGCLQHLKLSHSVGFIVHNRIGMDGSV